MSLRRFALQSVLSVGILTWVLYTTDVAAIVAILEEADTHYLLLGLGLYLTGDLISVWKLQLLLQIRNAPFRILWQYYYVGKLFNAFFPTTIGGDAVKAQKLRRYFDDFNAYSGVFMERFTGLVALISIAIITAAVFVEIIPTFVHVILYVVFLPALLAVSAILWNDKLSRYVPTLLSRLPGGHVFDISERIIGFHATVERYKSARRTVGLGLLVSLLFHVLLITTNIVFASAVGMTVDPVYFFVFVPIAAVVLFLPISIGGFGVRETVYLYFFTQVGAAAAEAVTLALLLNGMIVLSAAMGGIIYTGESVTHD